MTAKELINYFSEITPLVQDGLIKYKETIV